MNLTQALRLACAPADPGGITKPSDRISWEVVFALTTVGKAVVRGMTVPCSGNFVPLVGQVVPVLWKDGQPSLVLGHRARRAQFPNIIVPVGNGMIEELLVGNFDKTVPDVWYRNYERFTKLNIAGQLGANQAQQVKWGYDGKSFAVACTSGWWYIFTIDRDPTTVEGDWSPKLAWSGQPLKDSSQILSIIATSAYAYVDTYGMAHEDIVNQWETKPGYEPQWYEISYTPSFETEATGGGAASGSASRGFTLVQLLAGQTDGGIGTEVAQVLDWYLDGDGRLKFVISVYWDHFTVSSPNGSGSRTILNWVSGDSDNSGYEYDTTQGISSVGASCIVGAIKQDLTRIPEQHFFIYDAVGKGLQFATFPAAPELGQQTTVSQWATCEDHIHTENEDGPSPPPTELDNYYSGGSQGGSAGDYYKSVSLPPGGSFLIGNATAQLFRGDLGFVLAPFKSTPVTPGETVPWSLISRAYFHWMVTSNSAEDVRLWHYTVQTINIFQADSQPYALLVMARYPFLSGTGYINDIPQIGVFIINADSGAVVRTLRPFQYGLQGASLFAGNAHRIIWALNAPWYSPRVTFYMMNLLTGQETPFTTAQVTALFGTKTFLLSPDFAWDYNDPKQFYSTAQLPVIVADPALANLGALLTESLMVPGSIRAANNQAILEPLGEYQAT